MLTLESIRVRPTRKGLFSHSIYSPLLLGEVVDHVSVHQQQSTIRLLNLEPTYGLVQSIKKEPRMKSTQIHLTDPAID